MKIFEHEVLNFNASNRKAYTEMQDTLRDWGANGFEIISVTNDSVNPMSFVVFLKREVSAEGSPSEEAA